MWGLRTEAVRGGSEKLDPRRLAADIPRTAVLCNGDRVCPVVHRALYHRGAILTRLCWSNIAVGALPASTLCIQPWYS
jgi:hypothetical protein